MACSCNRTDAASAGNVQNRVFLNKIFFETREDSCPLIFDLQADEENFTQTLNIRSTNSCGCNSGCGCSSGCGCCGGINCDSRFTVTNSCVTVNALSLSPSSEFDADDVTVDGFEVTGLEFEDGRYVADLSGIMPEITKCPCAPVDRHICGGCGTARNCPEACDNNGHFILVETEGPWTALITIVLEGFVTTNGRSCDFKLTCKSNANIPVTFTGSNNFAVNCAEIPCQARGVSPILVFDFDACAVLLNPEITVNDSTSGCADAFNLTIEGDLVVTPNMFLQVIRPSLFALNATEVAVACDDVGQCDEWNAVKNTIGCGCSSNDNSDSNSCRRNSVSRRTVSGIACQCCDTNGYRF